MEGKKIMELLKDKETYRKLHTIGIMRDEIWLLHRKIDKLNTDVSVFESEIQKKHNLTFPEMIGLAIMGDAVLETELKRKHNPSKTMQSGKGRKL